MVARASNGQLSGSIYKRCGCRDRERGGRLEGRCPSRGHGGHGSWYFQFDLPRGIEGDRRRIRRGGFSTRREANDAMCRLRVPAPGDPGALTVTMADYMDVWLVRRPRGAPSTMRNYRLHIQRYLIPLFDLVLLEEVDARCVWKVMSRLLREGVDGKLVTLPTVNAVFKTLRAILNTAVLEGRLAHNPARYVKLPSHRRPKAVVWTCDVIEHWKATGQRPAVAVWTATQVARFLTATSDHWLYAAYHLVAFRGLRRGEVAGLRWCDIDLKAGLMFISQQTQRGGVGRQRTAQDPKTPGSRDWVVLDRVSVEVLEIHRTRQLQMLTDGFGNDTGYVFQMSDGNPLDPAYLSLAFRRLSAAAGLPPIRLHDLRHTCASLALQAGASLKVVQGTLRHQSIVLTADTYITVMPDGAREAADATAELILAHGCLIPGTTARRSSHRPRHAVLQAAA